MMQFGPLTGRRSLPCYCSMLDCLVAHCSLFILSFGFSVFAGDAVMCSGEKAGFRVQYKQKPIGSARETGDSL